MKKLSFHEMEEEDAKDKYLDASLHQIDKNRICLPINQLRLILGLKDYDFNNILTILCEKELKKKKGKSLDFYDTSNLIEQLLKKGKKWTKIKRKRNQAQISLKRSLLRKKKKMKMMIKRKMKKGYSQDWILLNRLEKRVDDVEESIKEGI